MSILRIFKLNFKLSKHTASSSTTMKSSKKNIASKKKEELSDGQTTSYFSPRKTRNHIKIKYENDKVNPLASTKEIQIKPSKAKKRNLTEQLAGTSKRENDAIESKEKQIKWEPKNWHQTLENLRKMRKEKLAPVDTMGCHKCSDDQADEKTQRYQTLIALMLSSQTKDQTTYDAMNRLKEHGLTPENIVQTSGTILEKLIAPVSFYKNKTKYIQKTSQILIDQYKSDIPKTIDELIQLPGVGPKMAHICMNSAWNIITGIGVDTHVHRISNRLHWTMKQTKDPEKTRRELENWLPKDLWHEVNEILVGFGQTICTPLHPKCNECLNADICPSRGIKK